MNDKLFSSAAAYQRKKHVVKPKVHSSKPKEHAFVIEAGRDYMALCDLLHAIDLVYSGGAGKHMVAAGGILVDGVVELRKTCKIRAGQVVTGPEFLIKVTAAA